MVINSFGIEILSPREFCNNIHEGKYLPTTNKNEVAKEINYNGCEFF